METKKKLLPVLAFLLCFLQMHVYGFGAVNYDPDFEVVEGVLVAYHGAGGDVVIPGDMGIKKIGVDAFTGNESILSVVIPVGVDTIGVAAFSSCSNMLSITISNTVEIIEPWAFVRCSSLTTITIPHSVKSIGGNTFSYCTGLTSITISDGLEYIGYNIFEHCSQLSAIHVSAGNLYFSSIEGVLYSKDQTILYYYPEGKSGDSFSIPSGVKEISTAAFIYCNNLKSITIPNTVENIRDAAFRACSGLTSISIPNSVESIGKGVFELCSKLSAIHVDGGNTYYTSDNGVLYSKDQTVLYRYPEGKGDLAYSISNRTIEISETAFMNCSKLTSVTIPSSVKKIGYQAFALCTGLTSITIPNSVETIEGYAFAYCESVIAVSISNSVKTIGEYVFVGCSELMAYTVGADNPNYSSIEGVLYNKDQTILYYYPNKKEETVFFIPNTVKEVANSSFAGCRRLMSVLIPNSVVTLGNEAFFYCDGLTSIEIPSSVVNFGYSVFTYSSFEDVTVYWDEPFNLTTNVFHFWEGRKYYLYVPIGTIEAYKAIDYWKNNNFIISEQAPPTGVSLDNTTAYVPVNYKFQLIATVSPRNATNKNIIWDSNNPSIATVSASGLITALNEGVATITATTESGNFKAQCVVTVANADFVVVNGILVAYRGAGGNVLIPNNLGITEIAAGVFEGNSTIASVTIPEGVSKINNKVFYNSSLTSVTIPASATFIGNDVFEECNNLLAINVTAGNPNFVSVDGVLYNQYRSSLLVFPKRKSGSFVIPNSVMYIGDRTFADCSGLTSITIPNSVIYMGESVFAGCNQLTEITAHWFDPLPVEASVFEGFDTGSCTLYVLEGRAAVYGETDVWKDFKTIVDNVQFIHVGGIGLNKSVLSMHINDTDQLFASIYPDDATNKNVSWESTVPAVVSVSSLGLITALSNGTARIIVRTDDSYRDAACEVTVRDPATIEWLGSNDNDWHNRENWRGEQLPARRDTVIIPGGADNFPVLSEPVTVNEIHFAPGAQIGRQSLLQGKAFIRYDLNERDRWHMLAMPLGQAYPGDFTFGGYPLSWVQTFSDEKESTTNEGGITKGGWVTAKGGDTGAFTFGDGFVLWLDNEKYPGIDKGLKILSGIHELPFFHHQAPGSPEKNKYDKIHFTHEYDGNAQSKFYYFAFNDGTGEYERINDNQYTVARSEDAFRLAGASVTKNLSSGTAGETTSPFALIGNPYMACLDFGSLYDANSGRIRSHYHVWTGEGYETYVHPFGSSGIENDNPLNQYIAPLQGFIIEKFATEPSSIFQFGEWMTFVDKNIQLRSSTSIGNKLDIVARNPVAGVRTFIAKYDGGQDAFGSMDARKIINNFSDVPEIYTLKPHNDRAIAVCANIINNDELLIPLGLATSYKGNITLSFSGMDGYDARLSLIDTEADKSFDLTGLASYDYQVNYTPKIVNGKTAVCEDRFFIRISKINTGLTENRAEKVSVFETNGRIQVVSSGSNPIKEVAVYDLQGALMYKSSPVSSISHTIIRNWPAGVYVVKVVSEKGTDTVKLIRKHD